MVKPVKKKVVETKFRVVHRSQRDPLAADNEASDNVLVPVATKKSAYET